MIKRWIQYIAVWLICLIFYFAHRQWMAWIVLLSASLLPLLSLAVSLPAMLLARFQLSMPNAVTAGTITPVDISLHCPLPAPEWKVRVEARHILTGDFWLLKAGKDCPTENCGGLYLHFSRGRVYDYMGLFALPRKVPADFRLIVRPQQCKPLDLPHPERNIVTYWRPKAGGGFSENHDLRLYRPGDSLRQIHWKLSGKTGKLIYREPMELVSNDLLLRLTHGGTPQQLNRKLGKLLWLGLYLQRRGLAYDVLADTVEGPKRWHVNSRRELMDVLDSLLCTPPLQQDQLTAPTVGSFWQYYIGGDAHETT